MNAPVSIGSVCSGYGGLDMAVRAVLGGRLAWVADPDPGAATILAHRYPTAPNLGDITTVDWSAVESVDVLTAGFPCQDISNAGHRTGIEGERSGIWSDVVEGIGLLRPRLVFVENVAALVVRGLDRVLADLAQIGFDARWDCVRASDVAAPHRRERLFLIAWPSHPQGPRLAWQGLRRRPSQRGGAATNASCHRWHARGTESERQQRGSEPAQRSGTDWGAYAPAIARWERASGRTAPPATEPGRTGPRLSPCFVEWLMGLPPGHVTAVPGLTRNQQLKALGNGVVPDQAATALTHLLATIKATAERSAA